MKKQLLIFVSFFVVSSFAVSRSNEADPSNFHIEYAVSVCEKPEDLLEKLGLHQEEAQTRKVVYFDTHDRFFFKKGLIVRLRYTHKKGDLTVKIRPFDRMKIKPEYFRSKGFKCEWDVNRQRETIACSEKKKISGKEAERVMQTKDISQALRDSQWIFAGISSDGHLPWDELKAYGPVETWRWENVVSGLDGESEIQVWQLPNGKNILEASFRVSPEKIDETRSLFGRFLHNHSIHLCATDKGKTAQVLQ